MDLITIPLKTSSNVDLIEPFKNLIALRFSTDDEPANFHHSIAEINNLRKLVCVKKEASMELLARYCDQLGALEGKIPAQDIKISFKWKNAFDKGLLSFFRAKRSLSVASISYERICCLFNLAALQSQVAAVQSRESDEGLKLAAKLLQSAGGIFTYLKSHVMRALQQEPTPDLKPETLASLSSLVLAQAQEIFVIKAINDKKKEAVIAQLASQCDEFYGDALKQMKQQSVSSIWEKDWISKLTSKQLAYYAIAQYFESCVCDPKNEIGEKIARLQDAIEAFKSAQQRVTDATVYQDYLNKAQKALAEAQQDNDFIYHEKVPDIKSLEPVGKTPLARISSVPERLSNNFKDLFEGLTPVVVYQAMALLDVRTVDVVNKELQRISEANQLLDRTLESLNLPAVLEKSLDEPLPRSLKKRSRAVRQFGGTEALNSLASDFSALLKRSEETLEEIERMLLEQRQFEHQYKAQFKEKWILPPFDKTTQTFTTDVAKYRRILACAANRFNVDVEKFESHRRGLELLSLPEGELEAAFRLASNYSNNNQTFAAAQLRLLMNQVNDLKSARSALEHEIKSARDIDLKQQFLSALVQNGVTNEAALSAEKLERTYGPLQKRFQETVNLQSTLVQQIQVFNEEHFKVRSASTRDHLLKELTAAHNIYLEILTNSQKDANLYEDLDPLLFKFRNKVADFCLARNAEKEQLVKDLKYSLARSSCSASVCSYGFKSTCTQPAILSYAT